MQSESFIGNDPLTRLNFPKHQSVLCCKYQMKISNNFFFMITWVSWIQCPFLRSVHLSRIITDRHHGLRIDVLAKLSGGYLRLTDSEQEDEKAVSPRGFI